MEGVWIKVEALEKLKQANRELEAELAALRAACRNWKGDEMTWRLVKEENPTFVCRKCKSDQLKYRIVEDSECHEDINYRCPDCGANWWVDGSDY